MNPLRPTPRNPMSCTPGLLKFSSLTPRLFFHSLPVFHRLLGLLVAVLTLTVVRAAVAEDAPEARFAAMSAAEVRAHELDTLRRVADLALIPPTLNTDPLPKYDYDKLDYGMTIGIERTPKGRLWACWVAGGDSPKAFFVLATSDDDGETWSKP